MSLREKQFLKKRIWLARCLSLGQLVKRIEGRINGAIPTSSMGAMFGSIFEMYVKDSQPLKNISGVVESGSPAPENAKGDTCEVRSTRMQVGAVGTGVN